MEYEMITREQLQQLCRYEITPSDMFPAGNWEEIATAIAGGCYEGEIETYSITLEDLQIGLQIPWTRKKPAGKFWMNGFVHS